MAFDLAEKPLDRHAHQAGPSKLGHVTEDMSGVQTLLIDPQGQQVHQMGCDLMEDLLGQGILLEQGDVPLQGPDGQLLCDRFEVQGIVDVHVEAVGIQGLVLGPIHELHDQHQAGHGIELLGRSSHARMEVPCDRLDGQQFQDDMAEDP